MSEDTSYYDYGFKMKKYWICEDCQKDDKNKTETMLTTNHRESLAYEGQNNKGNCHCRKQGLANQSIFTTQHGRHTENQIRSENISVMMVALDIAKMDKSYRPLWKFTYHIANEEPS